MKNLKTSQYDRIQCYSNQSQPELIKTEREAVFKRTSLGFKKRGGNRRLAKSGSWRDELSSAFASQVTYS